MKEPVKWEQVQINGRKEWRATQEWKDWRKQVMSEGFTKHNASKGSKKKGKNEPLTEDNHHENWKEVAFVSGSDRRILFCCCRSQTGQPYSGCGAVAIRNGRAGKLEVVVEPRFE